jgi:hypothetical protein
MAETEEYLAWLVRADELRDRLHDRRGLTPEDVTQLKEDLAEIERILADLRGVRR